MTPESATSRIYTDFSGLAKLKVSARAESPEAVKAVAKEFEAAFVEMMMKSLRDASSADGLMDNDGSRMYQDMFDKQIAVDISERGDFGIASVIEAQLTKTRQMPTVEKGVEGFGPSTQNLNQYLEHRHTAPPEPIIALQKSSPLIYDHTAQRPSQIVRKQQPEKTNFNSPEEFIQSMRPHAERAARKIGVDPDLLVAQAALETGWGKRMIKNNDGSNSHNLFGIKASHGWKGESVNVGSLEYIQGVVKKEVSAFRSYSSFTESFKDYVDFIKNQSRYDPAVNQAGNNKAYIQALQQAGYATDPNYANKVLDILERKSLQPVWKGNA